MENKKLSKRTKLIMVLLVLIALIGIFPIKEMILNPSIIGYVITGQTITSVYVSGIVIPHNCTIVLLEDWNLIGIPCLANDTSRDSVLAPITGEYNYIYTYVASNSSDQWKVYNPSMPAWVIQDLDEITEKQGYWVNMKTNQSFNMSGSLVFPSRIPLYEGWNLMGYPNNISRDAVQAFISIYGKYDQVWMYNATDDTYYYYNATVNDGTFREIDPNHGYWVKMDEDNVFFTI